MLFKGVVAAGIVGLLFVYGIPSAKQHVQSIGRGPVAQTTVHSNKHQAKPVDKLVVLAVPDRGENERGETLFRASVAVEFGTPLDGIVEGVPIARELRTGVYNCGAGLMAVETVILFNAQGDVVGTYDGLNKVLIAADDSTVKDELGIVCKAAPLLNPAKGTTYI
jgi:hypothetical protein